MDEKLLAQWDLYKAHIEVENRKLDAHNKRLFEIYLQREEPRERRFLCFRWNESLDPLSSMFNWRMYKAMMHKLKEPTWEDFLDWCSGEVQ